MTDSLATQGATSMADGLSAVTMLVTMAVALLAVLVVHLLIRRRGRSQQHSALARALVGVPEIHTLRADTREGAIREMIGVASRLIRYPDETTILRAVMRREAEMSTALVYGFAVPHARLTRLDRSYVLFGRSPLGIPWESIDGSLVRNVFLILSPEEDQHDQLKMLADLGRCAANEDCREVLATAGDCRAISRAISELAAR